MIDNAHGIKIDVETFENRRNSINSANVNFISLFQTDNDNIIVLQTKSTEATAKEGILNFDLKVNPSKLNLKPNSLFAFYDDEIYSSFYCGMSQIEYEINSENFSADFEGLNINKTTKTISETGSLNKHKVILYY